MRKSKRIIATVTSVMMLATSVFATPSAISAQAASAKSKAFSAYKKFLNSSKVESYFYSGKRSSYYFTYAYVDNNSVPELVVTNDMSMILFTYKNGKVKQVDTMSRKTLHNNFKYYKKTGIYEDCMAKRGLVYMVYRKMSGTKCSYKLQFETPIGTSSNYNGEYDVHYKYTGKYETKKISKSKFKSTLKSLTKKKKATVTNLKKNTKSNRNKYLK